MDAETKERPGPGCFVAVRMFGMLRGRIMVVKADEPLKKKDAEETRNDPHQDRADRGFNSISPVRMHTQGVRKEIKQGDADHNPCHETERDLHPTVCQPAPERYETTEHGYTKNQDE